MNCDKTFKENIITTLHGTDISKAKEGHDDDDDDDDDDNDINNFFEVIQAPNDNDYHESQHQNSNPAINHYLRSQITRVSQS
jgi:hypothetical protein